MHVLTDEALMAAVEQRDRQAFEELYDRYARMIFSFAVKQVGDRQRAEEIVQDLFSKLWHSNVHYDPTRSAIRTWLLVITKRLCIDYLRKTNPATQAGPIDEMDYALEASHEHGPERTAEQKELQQTISIAIDSLPEDQKQIVRQMYFQGKTQQELADELGIPIGTVKSRLRLAMTKLRKSLVAERLEELL